LREATASSQLAPRLPICLSSSLLLSLSLSLSLSFSLSHSRPLDQFIRAVDYARARARARALTSAKLELMLR